MVDASARRERSRDDVGRRLRIGVLPDPEYSPGGRTQRLVNLPVSLTIALQLRLPILAVRFRLVPVNWAAVPEAAVNEDDESVSCEGHVGPNLHGACLNL